MTQTGPDLSLIRQTWQKIWPEALEMWSRFTRLKPPCFCVSPEEEKKEGLSSSFAMIRLNDHRVMVSLSQIQKLGLQDFALEILSHEIGHHVFCPGDLTDLGRMNARIKRALMTYENAVGFIGNLYTDLLINDRLFREKKLRMDQVYLRASKKNTDPLWNFYLRIYEILWALPGGTLTGIPISATMEGDAQLGNRLIRSYARDWVRGAGRFAALCFPYLAENGTGSTEKIMAPWLDAAEAGEGADIPQGLTEMDEDEASGSLHPALEGSEETDGKEKSEKSSQKGGGGNFREPFEYGQILKSMGIQLSDREIAMRYYRERAIPYLIPFPSEELPQSEDPLPEGFQPWDIGSSMENIHWVETAVRSPVVIPGYTVFEQVFGVSEGMEPKREPVDLDLYVDCSGSMPDPATHVSYLTLAGAIIALSAFRAGSRVQATLWSGPMEFETTGGFVSDEKEVLRILTGYFGGCTAFPIHILRETFKNRKKNQRKVHILVISDDGVTTIFDQDEQGGSGEEITPMALEKAGGGGTFVLNLYGDWKKDQKLVMASKMGFEISSIKNWEDLIEFSRRFARKHYGKGAKP